MYRVYAKKKLVNTSSFFQRPSWNFLFRLLCYCTHLLGWFYWI